MVKAQLVGPSSATEIEDFLKEHVPSNNSSSGNYYVKATKKSPLPREEKQKKTWSAFVVEATPFEEELIQKCQTIRDYAPTRGSKARGTLSQKQLREMEHAKFHHHIKEVAIKHGLVAGKWMAFLNPDEVDEAWGNVVKGIADPKGKLALQGVNYARVTAKSTDRFPHILQIYLNDSYDDANVETVFKIIVEMMGFTPTAYKTSAMEVLGITSSHESKIGVSLYGKLSFMNDRELKKAIATHQTTGAPAAISPLVGSPAQPDIDWDFEFVPDTAQTYLSAEGAGIGSHDFAYDEEETPVRMTRGRAKRRKLEEEGEDVKPVLKNEEEQEESKVKKEDEGQDSAKVKKEEEDDDVIIVKSEEEEKEPESDGETYQPQAADGEGEAPRRRGKKRKSRLSR